MSSRFASIRRHVTFANVLSTLTLFVVLAGGSAVAANQLAKDSVGSKQLKKNSVGAAKIKKNAVTTAKLKKNSVTPAKVKPASLGDPDLGAGVPFAHIVEKFRSSLALPVPNEAGPKLTVLPFSASYTQEAGRADKYVGYVDVSLSPSCVSREIVAILMLDPENPTEIGLATISSVAGVGGLFELGSAASAERINIGPYPLGGTRVGPPTATPHNLVIAVKSKCGSGEGVSITGAGIDVIGVK